VSIKTECPRISTWTLLQRVPSHWGVPEGGQAPEPSSQEIRTGTFEPPSPKCVPNPAGAESAPTSLIHAASSHDVTGTSPRPEPAKFPEVPPTSLQSDGLGATGGPRPGEGLSVPQSENNHDSIHVLPSPCGTLSSPCGTTRSLSRPDFMLGGL
jgi:hypothetical protein